MTAESISVAIAATHAAEGQTQSMQWELHGTVLPTIRFKPAAIKFGTESNRRTRLESNVSVEAASNIERIECASAVNWTVEVSRNQDGPGNQFRMVVRSQGPLVPRQLSDTIYVTPIALNGVRLPDKKLTITGEIVQDVVAIPAQVHCGRQPYGALVEETIQLRSLTERRFAVRRVVCNNPDIEIARIGKDDDANPWVYSLRIHCSTEGAQEVVPEFDIQDEDGSRSKVTIPVRYQGITDCAGAKN
jgi:hypothetical protein